MYNDVVKCQVFILSCDHEKKKIWWQVLSKPESQVSSQAFQT